MGNLINIRVLQHDTNDQIRIGMAYPIIDLDKAEKDIVDNYEKKTAWCGGFKAACEKYYQRIAIVRADTLEVIRPIYPRLSKFLMPVLLVLTVGISIYTLTLPNAMEGVSYYLIPDFSKLSIWTFAAALGQLFFSMSIAMGIMVTYGSYTKDEVNLTKSVNQIEIFDTAVALLAGLMVVPAVYVFSGEEGLGASGPGLMFITLPKVFNEMPAGVIIGFLFFVLVFFAAITSSISVMEAIVSSLMDKFKLTRIKSCLIVIGICLIMGIPSSLGNGIWSNVKILGMDFLTFFDFLSNSIIMPIVALCTCILIGWVIKPKTIADEVTRNGERFSRRALFDVMIKYIAPICLVFILISYTLAQFGIISL